MKGATMIADRAGFDSIDRPQSFPIWHPVVLLGMIAALVILSSRSHSASSSGISHRFIAYLVVAAAEWGMVAWIAFGCRFQNQSIRSLLGEFGAGLRTILRDCGLAIAFLVVANLLIGLLQQLLPAAPNAQLMNLLPHTSWEAAAFLALTVTAAFCEELIYRGYIQRQFAAWTGNLPVSIALQGIVFGASHAYQGSRMVLAIALYGCFFGLLAAWRRSLRPGMIAHLVQDAVGGLIMARTLIK